MPNYEWQKLSAKDEKYALVDIRNGNPRAIALLTKATLYENHGQQRYILNYFENSAISSHRAHLYADTLDEAKERAIEHLTGVISNKLEKWKDMLEIFNFPVNVNDGISWRWNRDSADENKYILTREENGNMNKAAMLILRFNEDDTEPVYVLKTINNEFINYIIAEDVEQAMRISLENYKIYAGERR